MSCRRLCRTAIAGAALTMFGFSLAYAQEIDDLQNVRPPLPPLSHMQRRATMVMWNSARGMVAQGLADCASGKRKEGLETINSATAAISDGMQGSHKRE